MKRTAPFLLVVLCMAALAAHKKVQSPKDAEQSSTAGAVMTNRTVAQSSISKAPPSPLSFIVLPPPRTNLVTHKLFAWDEDPDFQPLVMFYTIYMGTNAGVYIWSDTTTNLTYDFARTNWAERIARHFVTVSATDEFMQETDVSNEIHFPAFDADHVRITWTANWPICTLWYEYEAQGTPGMGYQLAVLHYTNEFDEFIDKSLPAKFYYLDKPDILTITLFNPNP
jgi:hypothetical protein